MFNATVEVAGQTELFKTLKIVIEKIAHVLNHRDIALKHDCLDSLQTC